MKTNVRQLVFVALLVAIPLGAYFWVFRPANQQFRAKREEVDKKAEKLESLRQATCRISDLNAEVDKLSEAVVFFESKLPGRHEIHKVLAQISKIADGQNLETRLFETLRPKKGPRYSELPIKIEVCGGFESYYQFLLDLERIPRITRITDMRLKRDAPDGTVTAKFTVSIFFESSASKA